MLESQRNQTQAMLDAFKTSQATLFNWDPLITVGTTLAERLVDRLVPPIPQPIPPQTQPIPQPTPAAHASTTTDPRLDTLVNSVSKLSSTVDQLVSTVAQQGQIIAQQGKILDTLTQLVAATKGMPTSDSGSSSTPPAAPDSTTPPAAPAPPTGNPTVPPAPSANSALSVLTRNNITLIDDSGGLYHNTPLTGNSNQMVDDINIAKKTGIRKLHTDVYIPVAKPFERNLPLDKVVTADLEALITKEGLNQIYMASWYRVFEGNPILKVFDITQFGNNIQEMLKAFWLSILQEAKGCSVYFHNWAGYDAILSMDSLISLNSLGYSFNPILQKGKVICLTVLLNREVVITIKDSIKMLPGSIARLAKDFKVETQKEHFPHYFNPLELHGDLNWSGPLPDYKYFEPKRTSQVDYDGMLKEFPNNSWNFLGVSKHYIEGDVKALHQILIAFFKGLKEQFPINPLKSLSTPGLAFTTWKTVQLPKLHKEGHKVYDLSRTSDPLFREAYLGGIVDVYKPVLIGKGYYYDVNSLYPTAMCRPMPVGSPSEVYLTPALFAQGDFFGFLKATVQAPENEYIGLLPTRLNGRLVCPGGTFSGFFFSEELRLALENGYRLLSISQAYLFQRGINTFRDLIQELNQIKVKAQAANQPSIRNVAKLLMNSMYGRFGMRTAPVKDELVTLKRAREIMQSYQVQDCISLGGLELISYIVSLPVSSYPQNNHWNKSINELPGQTNVPLAAAITAYSRMIINQYKIKAIEAGLKIFYSDTDSLVLNGQLPSELIDASKLGMLKLEHELNEAYFVAPKVYWLKTSEGSEI